MRFFLDQDNCGHWYVVPEDKRREWYDWLDLDEDDERAWDAPSWAKGINGSQARVTFADPKWNNG